jgi:hydrocephalus-inducing protein
LDKLKQVTAVNPFEEQRRLAAENKAKDPKKKGPEETEEADLKKQQSLEALIEELTFEKKDISYIPVHFNMNQLFKSVLELVDAPVYPDPNTLPVPEPVFH